MKLENQICALEASKRLKELDIKQESLFYWNQFRNESFPKDQWSNVYNDLIRGGQRKNWQERSYLKDLEFYSAFTASELMSLLPARITIDIGQPFNSFTLVIRKCTALNIQYIANYQCDTCGGEEFPSFSHMLPHNVYDENLADCLAKLLIKLIELGHFHPEKVQDESSLL